MGNQQNRIKQLGRLRYIEPTNFSEKEEGTLSDRVNFPYEDYCMAIDLTIRQTNRYSCGWWDESGEVNEITYSSNNGTLSFLGGSKIGEENEGYYTTKFTDVSMTNPERNTSECLGITSIDIAYDSWWYPQVTIKFVDVRGGTVMLPAEKDYYGNNDNPVTSSIYKAFFSFPYPMFVLKVKGFYGKGVTYNLALHNTSFDFDSNTGNFNITASFIGYKFGIYTDIPLTFIACAPFMEGGREYWDSKIKSGEFRFRTREGLPGSPMITIPELKYKLAMATYNQEYIELAEQGDKDLNFLQGKKDVLTGIISNNPLNEWTDGNDIPGAGDREKKYIYKVFPNYYDMEKHFTKTVFEFIGDVKQYDSMYNEKLCDYFKIFDVVDGSLTSFVKKGGEEHGEENDKYKGMTIYVIINDFKVWYGSRATDFVKYDGSCVNHYFNYPEQPTNRYFTGDTATTTTHKIDIWMNQNATGSYKNNYEKRYAYAHGVRALLEANNSFEPEMYALTEKVKEWALLYKGEDSYKDFYLIVAIDKRAVKTKQEMYEYFVNESKGIDLELENANIEYRKKHDETIERLLTFRPSIKNMYDLMFAHMDTFMHVFYSSTKIIKDQLDGVTDRGVREKDRHYILDGFTDTENVKIKQSDGTIINNSNLRSKYLPPYAAYYTNVYDGVNCNKKLLWIGDVHDGYLLDEFNFINNLTYAARNYYDKVKQIETLIEGLNDTGNTLDTTFASGDAPDFMTHDFIPTTTFDFMFKGRYGNPYYKIKDSINSTSDVIRSNVEFIFALRTYQYGHLIRGKNETDLYSLYESNFDNNFAKNCETFGALEAINLFKAVGDNFSNGFINFLSGACDAVMTNDTMKMLNSGQRFINSIIGLEDNHGILTTDKNFEKRIFNIEEKWRSNANSKEKYNYLVYDYHKGYRLSTDEVNKYGGDSGIENYTMFPFFTTGIKDTQKKYTYGGDMFKDQTMAPIKLYSNLYNTDNIDITTFVMFNVRDYIENIYKYIKLEIDASTRYLNTDGVIYGNRSTGDFNGLLGENTAVDADWYLKNHFNNITGNNDNFLKDEEGNFGQLRGQFFNNILINNDEEYYLNDSENNKYGLINSSKAEKSLDGDFNQLKYTHIKYTTFDYTFDNNNPGSIFNNSIYWEQDNIKAKACLFLMSISIHGNGSLGLMESNDNGKVYKALLLKEGAIYWYYETLGNEGGVKYPEHVYKMKNDNGTRAIDENIQVTVSPSLVGNLGLPIDTNVYDWRKEIESSSFGADSYKCFGFNIRSCVNFGFPEMKALSPSRVKVLKKFFEEWAENDFKNNESELTNLEYYSRDIADVKKDIYKGYSRKDVLLKGLDGAALTMSGSPYWYFFAYAECVVSATEAYTFRLAKDSDAEDVDLIYDNPMWIYGSDTDNDGKTDTYSNRNYDNGLDVIVQLRYNPMAPETAKLKKLMEFVNDTFLSIYTVFELYSTYDTQVYGNVPGESIHDTGKLPVKFSSFFYNKSDVVISPPMYASYYVFLSAYLGFIKQLYYTYKIILDQYKARDENGLYYANVNSYKNAVNSYESKDLKLSTYMTVKNLYDKWLCFPYNGPRKTWVLNRKGESEFDNFIYVDSYYNDIGDHLLVNPTKVSQWLSTLVPSSDIGSTEGLMTYTGRTLYEFLTEVAQNVGANLFAVPQKFSMTDDNSVREMFTPMSLYSNWDDDSTGYVFMYTYQPSQHLGDSSTSSVDMNGWSPEGDGVDLTDNEIVGSILGDTGNFYNIPAFGVTYGKQNQSIFKNINLSTTSMAVTEASISSTLNIASKASEGPREFPLYGQDLYRVYSNYSYNCSVETMGNMQIMPMMYFQLNNIPFWKGGYQIVRVHHSIVPGNITTTFEGVRINRHAIPLSDEAILFIPEYIEESQGTTKQTTSTTTTTFTDLGEGRQSIPDNSFTYLAQGLSKNIIDTSGTYGGPTNYQNHGMTMLHDCEGNINSQLSFTAQFDGTNVTDKKPIIYIHPAHYYNHKTANSAKGCLPGCTGEHCWSLNVVEKMYNILKDCEYNDGTSYNVHKGRTNNTTSYSGKEVYELVGKYGSKKVISIVPHWNGGAGSRWEGIINSNGQTTRLDTIKLLECIAVEAAAVKSSASTYTNMPEGMMSGTIGINAFYGSASTDPGTMPNCAAALTENWYADYDNWKGKEWLDTDEAINIIAEMHARGIKRYIDSLWT